MAQRGLGDRVGQTLDVPPPALQARKVPAVSLGRAVERRGEVQDLEAHGVRRERRRGSRRKQPSDGRQELTDLLQRILFSGVVGRPQQVRAESRLGDLQLAQRELRKRAPRGHLAAEGAAAGDAGAPVLLFAAGEVADDEGPPQLLEGGVTLRAGPVEDADLARRGGDAVTGGGRVGLLVADDAALRPLLREAVVPVHEVVAPQPGLDALLLQVAVDLEHVVGVEGARILAPAARAEGSRPPLVVADVHPLRAQHVDVLVQDVEQDAVGLRVRGAVGVRPAHVGVLGHVAPRRGDVVGVAERLYLGDDLEPVSFGPFREAPHVVFLDVRTAADPHVERGGKAPSGPERDALAELVHRLAVGVPLSDRASPAGADLRVGLETHPSAHLEHDAVELEAQQEVAEVAPGEAELVAPRQVEVDPAHGQERPVAHARPAHGDALLAPPVDELDEGRDAVERAAVVAPGDCGSRRVDREQVALRGFGHRRRGARDRAGHRCGRRLADYDRRPAFRRGTDHDGERDAELVGHQLRQQPPRPLRALVARGHDHDGIGEQQPRLLVAALARERPDRVGRPRRLHRRGGGQERDEGGGQHRYWCPPAYSIWARVSARRSAWGSSSRAFASSASAAAALPFSRSTSDSR